ncbi:MAG: dihydroflavonol-4-reductase [Chloroflexi bacterium]|nr:MAG: dihydroflavonol-4-reductase [Chloroflexota bacterium]
MTVALVTGATGFIGAHVVRALLAQDDVEVRALVRSGSDTPALHGLPVQRLTGDLTDAASLRHALTGVDVLFHLAARYELAQSDHDLTMQTNVAGTIALMRAAIDAGLERVVYTSSTAAVGFADPHGVPADESRWLDPANAAGPYELSKLRAERALHALVHEEGLPAVIVNPTAPIGPLDLRPTPTGRLIRDAARGRLPGYMRSAGLNIVDVRDVAQGHVLAWRRGRIGERYILGHQDGNLTMAEIVTRAARAAGRRPPRLPVPYPLARAYAQIDERLISPRLGRPPQAPIAGVRLARHRLWFRVDKAVRELALPQSSLNTAFHDAVASFRPNPPA